MDEAPELSEAWRPYQTEHEWRIAVLGELRELRLLLAHLCVLVERTELPVEKEPVARSGEPSDSSEPLATWILTDARVQAIEAAVEQEQRVRGQVYGG